jgi:hypothetical protein
MIQELDSQGIVTKDEIVEYYLKGKKKRGKITEERFTTPHLLLNRGDSKMKSLILTNITMKRYQIGLVLLREILIG